MDMRRIWRRIIRIPTLNRFLVFNAIVAIILLVVSCSSFLPSPECRTRLKEESARLPCGDDVEKEYLYNHRRRTTDVHHGRDRAKPRREGELYKLGRSESTAASEKYQEDDSMHGIDPSDPLVEDSNIAEGQTAYCKVEDKEKCSPSGNESTVLASEMHREYDSDVYGVDPSDPLDEDYIPDGQPHHVEDEEKYSPSCNGSRIEYQDYSDEYGVDPPDEDYVAERQTHHGEDREKYSPSSNVGCSVAIHIRHQDYWDVYLIDLSELDGDYEVGGQTHHVEDREESPSNSIGTRGVSSTGVCLIDPSDPLVGDYIAEGQTHDVQDREGRTTSSDRNTNTWTSAVDIEAIVLDPLEMKTMYCAGRTRRSTNTDEYCAMACLWHTMMSYCLEQDPALLPLYNRSTVCRFIVEKYRRYAGE